MLLWRVWSSPGLHQARHQRREGTPGHAWPLVSPPLAAMNDGFPGCAGAKYPPFGHPPEAAVAQAKPRMGARETRRTLPVENFQVPGHASRLRRIA
jgi:hypothetical protein